MARSPRTKTVKKRLGNAHNADFRLLRAEKEEHALGCVPSHRPGRGRSIVVQHQVNVNVRKEKKTQSNQSTRAKMSQSKRTVKNMALSSLVLVRLLPAVQAEASLGAGMGDDTARCAGLR